MLNAGDTAFLMMCTAMVCLMTPALAFFYGLVRKTDILTIMFQTFVCLGLVAVIWVLGGFSLVFGPTSARSSAIRSRFSECMG